MPGSKDNRAGNGRLRLRVFQVLLLVLLFVIWYVLTSPTLLPPIYFTEANQAAFFFGEPVKVFARLWQWFVSGEIYEHLWVTLVETLLAFLIGTVSGVVIGLWLALSPTASAVLDPYIKAVNAMLRVTLVFFIVFFNVYQGVREVSPVVLANARMLGASPRQLLRYVYVPSAMSWVFASLHNSVGLAFVGAVVGEYLGSAKGVGYLIHQAEGFFDMNTVVAGIVLLTIFALVLDWAVGTAEKRLMVWQPRSGETERA